MTLRKDTDVWSCLRPWPTLPAAPDLSSELGLRPPRSQRAVVSPAHRRGLGTSSRLAVCRVERGVSG